MSRTTRRHESASKQSRRGPQNPKESDDRKARLKSNKQVRRNERAELRRDWR